MLKEYIGEIYSQYKKNMVFITNNILLKKSSLLKNNMKGSMFKNYLYEM